jgi:hypothetical protein
VGNCETSIDRLMAESVLLARWTHRRGFGLFSWHSEDAVHFEQLSQENPTCVSYDRIKPVCRHFKELLASMANQSARTCTPPSPSLKMPPHSMCNGRAIESLSLSAPSLAQTDHLSEGWIALERGLDTRTVLCTSNGAHILARAGMQREAATCCGTVQKTKAVPALAFVSPVIQVGWKKL